MPEYQPITKAPRPGIAFPIFILALFVTGQLTGCSSPRPERLRPSGLNSHYNLPAELSFHDYLALTRDTLRRARLEPAGPERDRMVEANLPFELQPAPSQGQTSPRPRSRKGILLLHGLTDSPYQLQPLARYFQSRGFLVRAVLLPGHGTRPGDLLEVRCEDWEKACRFGVEGLSSQVDQVYLGGFSTGAALAVQYALENPEKISGLFLFAPSLKIKSDLAWLTLPVSRFKDWLEIHADQNWAKYESFAVNAGAQVYRLTRKIVRLVENERKRLKLPVSLVLSLEDQVIDSRFTLDFFRRYMDNPDNRLLLFTTPRSGFKSTDPRMRISDRQVSLPKILDLSHLALLLPESDPHYGLKGDYRNCLHYPEQSPARQTCENGGADWLGEISPDNLDRGVVQRITFNPKFEEMLTFLDEFQTDLP